MYSTLVVHFVGEEGGFDGGEAAEAPAGGGHGFYQFGFEEAGGGELFEVGVEEALVVGGRFGGEDGGDRSGGRRRRTVSPWRRALREERARPAEVAGPWDLAPLMRAVVDFLLDLGLGLVGILAPG